MCKGDCQACDKPLVKLRKKKDWVGRKYHAECFKEIMQKIKWYDFLIDISDDKEIKNKYIKEKEAFKELPKIEKKKKPKKN
jgi:hypothetical protein